MGGGGLRLNETSRVKRLLLLITVVVLQKCQLLVLQKSVLLNTFRAEKYLYNMLNLSKIASVEPKLWIFEGLIDGQFWIENNMFKQLIGT